MEAEQEATIRTGVQTGGWEYSSSDAAGDWRQIQNALIQNARVRNETAEEAEDPRQTPIRVAWEMMGEDGSMAAEKAAQILEERFLQWDRDEQDGRRQVFTEQVQEIYTEQAEEWERLSSLSVCHGLPRTVRQPAILRYSLSPTLSRDLFSLAHSRPISHAHSLAPTDSNCREQADSLRCSATTRARHSKVCVTP